MAPDGSVNIDSSIDGSGFSKGFSKLGSAAKTALGATTGIIAGTATALGGLAAAAIKTGADFESQMSRVQAISGATGAEFDALNKLAIQLGADTKFSATEAAKGMENLASAGFSVSEITQAMPGMLDLAASSGEELAASADIAASTLRGFGLAADQAGHVADVLAKNAAATNAAVADTGEAMKYVAPVAQSAGWSLESVTAAIGEMANAGIKGTQAGTVLRGALTSLMNPSKQQAAAMQAIGFSAYDARGQMKSLSQMISDLQKGTANLSEEQRNQYIATIFGTEALSGMQVLIQQGSGNLDALTQSLVNSNGAAASMAATMNDNLKGAVQNLTGSLESLGIEFYQSIDNPLKDVVNKANGYVGQLSGAFKNGGIQGLVVELGSVLSSAISNIAAQAPQFITLATKLIQSFIQGISTNLPQLSNSAIQILTTLINGILVLLPQLLSLAVRLIITLAQGLSQQLPTLIPVAVNAIITLAEGLMSNLPQIIQAAIQIIVALIQGMMNALPQLFGEIPNIIMGIIQALVDALPMLIQAAPQIIVSIIMGIIKALPQLIAYAPKIITAVISGLIQALPQLWMMGPQMIKSLWDGLKNQNWAEIGGNIIKGIVDGFKNAWKYLSDGVQNAGKNIVNGFKDFFDIHSPSRLLRDAIGKMLPPGISIGFEAAMPRAIKEMQSQLSGMVYRMQAEVGVQQANAGAYASAANVPRISSASQTGGGVTYRQEVNNYSPKALSPAETARQTRNATRQLILQAR